MTAETPASNGAGEHLGTAPRRPMRGPSSGEDETGAQAIIAAVDLLAHYWSRPVIEEVASWAEASDLEVETDRRISSDPLREPVKLPGLEEAPDCLTSTSAYSWAPGRCLAHPMSPFGARTSPSISGGR